MKFRTYLNEGKVMFFELKKLKYFSKRTIKDLLFSQEFAVARISIDKGKVGGILTDTKRFIRSLIKQDIESTKELGFDFTKDQLADHKYLKSI